MIESGVNENMALYKVGWKSCSQKADQGAGGAGQAYKEGVRIQT